MWWGCLFFVLLVFIASTVTLCENLHGKFTSIIRRFHTFTRFLPRRTRQCSLFEDVEKAKMLFETTRQHLDGLLQFSTSSLSISAEVREYAAFLLNKALIASSFKKVERRKVSRRSHYRSLVEEKDTHLEQLPVSHIEDWDESNFLNLSKQQHSAVVELLSQMKELLPSHLSDFEKSIIKLEAQMMLEEATFQAVERSVKKAEETFGASL